MKKILGMCTALLLFVPLLALALTTTNDVNVSTGGGTAAGGSATVTGNSDADADVRTIMNSGSGGTSYRTEIRTERDGVVRTLSKERTIPAGERVEIRTATTSEKHIGRFSGISFSTFWARIRLFFGFWKAHR